MKKPHVVGAIFARGGSKGIPRKNIRKLCGKPLIAYSIETAKACPSINRVIVSTDDEEIANVARISGAEIPFVRPSELAQDHSPEWLAWRHALAELTKDRNCPNIDCLVSLPTTSPLRSVSDVESCIRLFFETNADVVITIQETNRSPYFNMVIVDAEGSVSLAVKNNLGVTRRQDCPPIFDMTTVAYAMRPEFIMKANSIFEGNVRAVKVPRDRAVDIDDELDFRMAELLLEKQKAAEGDVLCAR